MRPRQNIRGKSKNRVSKVIHRISISQINPKLGKSRKQAKVLHSAYMSTMNIQGSQAEANPTQPRASSGSLSGLSPWGMVQVVRDCQCGSLFQQRVKYVPFFHSALFIRSVIIHRWLEYQWKSYYMGTRVVDNLGHCFPTFVEPWHIFYIRDISQCSTNAKCHKMYM